MNIKTTITPRIYIACLSSYNNGRLYGEWFDASIGLDYLQEGIRDMLKGSEERMAEEWAIHDYEGFGSYKISESHDLEELSSIAEILIHKDDDEREVFTQLLNDGGVDYAKQRLEDDFIGCFESENDFIYNYVEDTGMLDNVPKEFVNYFDYKSFLNDMVLNGDIFSIVVAYDKHYYFHNS